MVRPVAKVGRYAVYGAIASGGMASVHWGRLLGESGFARVVAIKRLHPHIAADPEFITMLRDEARIVARIRHPNVVPTLDMVSGDGELILVMEYVHGEALSRLLRTLRDRGEAVPPRIATAILCGVLEGLHAAHEATDARGQPLGVVHRDVTPHNVLVGTDGVARIADFGVARAAGRMQSSTRQGSLKGKIGYMSVEQIRSQEVDRRTDVYAAAVVLWECLTGQRAFEADDDVAVMAKVLVDDLAPPSKLARGVPATLDAVVLKALSRERSARFATARDMAVALEATCPIASTREVGEWVEALAKTTLQERARALSAVESYDMQIETSGPHPAVSLLSSSIPHMIDPEGEATQAAVPASRRSDSVPQPLDLPTIEPVSTVTRLTASSAPRTTTTAPPASRRPVFVVVLIAAAVTIAVATLASRSSGPTAPTTASASAVAVPPPPAREPDAPSATTAAASASAAPSASSRIKKGAPARPDCADPFRAGPDGILHVRPECMK